jgi:hypothetical protein
LAQENRNEHPNHNRNCSRRIVLRCCKPGVIAFSRQSAVLMIELMEAGDFWMFLEQISNGAPDEGRA